MNAWIHDYGGRHDRVSIPTIWVALILSLLVHIAVLWQWLPRLSFPALQPAPTDTLVVQLSRPAGPPPARAALPETQPAPRPPPAPRARAAPKTPAVPVPRPKSAPREIAIKPPAADTAPPAPPATAASPPAAGDLSSYIEARRRARAAASQEPAPPDDERTRGERIAAANLAQQPQAFGYDPSKSGGVFEVKRLGYNSAEFMFYGWNKDMRRSTAQLIEVSRGSASDIRLAVVRRMIAIIREHEQGDFLWVSQRLGRDIMLSARARDNAGLEDFMMREFFDNRR